MLDTPLLTKPLFVLRRLGRRLWVRTSLISALAILSALLGPALGPLVPDDLARRIRADAVATILEILASSMLAVTTFSVTVMVVARQWASIQSTPRAHRVVQEDPVTQIALATFLGAFVFALVSLILVETDTYEDRALTVLFGFTLAVILLVVIAMLRWIDHLSELGGVSETAARIEAAARAAFARRLEEPCLGGRPCTFDEIPAQAAAVAAPATGYVQHIDAGILDACAEAHGARLWIAAPPGFFVAEGDPLVRMTEALPEATVQRAFSIGDSRSFDQDPSYGLLVLSEIAQRALSPGVNDPGTAISVIGRLLRLLLPVADQPPSSGEPSYPRIAVPEVAAEAHLRDAFAAIARDGAGKVEVQLALQDGYARLAARGDAAMREAARALSREALDLAGNGLALEADLGRVRAAARRPSLT